METGLGRPDGDVKAHGGIAEREADVVDEDDDSALVDRDSIERLSHPVPLLERQHGVTRSGGLQVEDRVHGLEGGADDYLVKPFALAELIARVKVLTRRHRSRQGSVLSMADLRMDLEARRAWIGEQPLELSSREWAVLEYLLSRVGHVVGKEQILQAISGWDDALSENAVEVYVSRLRPKIEPAGLRIRAVRGFGYLVEEVPGGAPAPARA